MKKNKIYVVTMYRWGSHEHHSYVVYAGLSKSGAMKAGEEERLYRGGNKYYPEILEVTPDSEKEIEVIKEC